MVIFGFGDKMVKCDSCEWVGSIDQAESREQKEFGKQLYVARYCPQCGAWLRWVPIGSAALEQAESIFASAQRKK